MSRFSACSPSVCCSSSLNGGIDLSVGSTLGLAGVVAGFLMQGVTLPQLGIILYPSVWVVVVLTCLLGAVVGAVNGVLIAYLRVPAFVATLGVLYVARGIALLMTNGLTYNNLGGRRNSAIPASIGSASTVSPGVPIGVIVLLVFAVVCHILLARTAFGRWLYSSGGNERAAELSGRAGQARENHRLCAVRASARPLPAWCCPRSSHPQVRRPARPTS
jgi:erythritol transport system permease protein